MKHKLLDTLLDKTVQYLLELKEKSPYMFLSTPLSAPELKIEDPLVPNKVFVKPITPIISIQKEEKIEPEPQVIRETKKPPSTPTFSTQQPKTHQKDLMQDIKATLGKITPSLKFIETIPKDTLAKKIKYAWKEQTNIPDVLILATKSPVLPFLKEVAKAIELHFFSSRVLEVDEFEKQNKWEALLGTPNLKMVITPDGVLWSCKNLLRYYQEFPSKQERFLGKIPLLLLPDPSLYLKDPALKRSLWNLLCQMLKPLQQ